MEALRLVLSAVLITANFINAQHQPHCASGRDGQVIVHLFSWKWTDITKECENVLGPAGFCGVQVSPPNEHRIVTSPNRPWWERYQPVSWKLDSASGSRAEFKTMVERCNAAGVRIYIDAVINHMAGIDSGTGYGTGGSYYNTQNMQFDGVPFGRLDFGTACSTANGNIADYGDVNQVRNCRLLGLLDLNGGSDYVRQKLADYFNDMIDIGIDGVRIDAAKHMWPADISGVLGKTRDTKFGGKPYVFQEVIDLYGSEPIKAGDYVHIGAVTEFKYGLKMGEIFKRNQVSMKDLKTFGSSWGMLSSGNALVFVDNHDNQRGHGGGGNIITYKESRAYKMAVVFMLSWPYGVPRVMSSYDFHEDFTGPPASSPNESGLCENGWICEHRWRQISNMVAWRNSAGSSAVENWWSNGNNQIAYSRGSASFIAFNKNDNSMNEWLTTGLPSGSYCDVISGSLVNGQCTGSTITVSGDSKANIQIDGQSEDPIIAIHIGAKVSNSNNPPAGTAPPSVTTPPSGTSPPAGKQRTIVLLKKQTQTGQDIFLRGGCGSTCTVPIDYIGRSGSHFASYTAWSAGDTVLDWTGGEQGQGTHQGASAQGSPMAWTSNVPSSAGYVSENSYGDHYWLWDVYMDCSKTVGGYFEVKGYMNGEWESDISQSTCSGQRSPKLLQSVSKNHLARCGYKNVFEWNSDSCLMELLSAPANSIIG